MCIFDRKIYLWKVAEGEPDRLIRICKYKEVPSHRKKSKSAARSVINKRSNHKHDYENVIIRSWDEQSFFWGERCRICGRVKDGNWAKADAYKDFVKKTVCVNGYTFKVFYEPSEVRKMHPDTAILAHKTGTDEYEEI